VLTTFLSRAEVSRHMQALHLLSELRSSFASSQRSTSTGHFAFTSGTTAAAVRPASLPSIPAWAVTVRTTSPRGERVVLQLHDGATGQVLAVMDAGHLTALCAALVGALAADVLSRPDAKNVAVLGAGAAASGALKALRLVRSIERVWLYEPHAADNIELAHRLQQTLSMAVTPAASAADAVKDADLVVLTGAVELGVVRLRPGTHVTVLNANGALAAPWPMGALGEAQWFCDDAGHDVAWAPTCVQLGHVVAGARAARLSPEDVTVFLSVSPPHLDLLAAWHVFEGARHDEHLTRIDLEA
jgi:ornithine cyclodeaminase/alanine dehydrogenase-like protein (mu-crystallin family)